MSTEAFPFTGLYLKSRFRLMGAQVSTKRRSSKYLGTPCSPRLCHGQRVLVGRMQAKGQLSETRKHWIATMKLIMSIYLTETRKHGITTIKVMTNMWLTETRKHGIATIKVIMNMCWTETGAFMKSLCSKNIHEPFSNCNEKFHIWLW